MTTRDSRNNAVHEKLAWILYEYEVDELGNCSSKTWEWK